MASANHAVCATDTILSRSTYKPHDMNKPTPEQIAKLPAWAREHINTLERQRSQAVTTLNEFVDRDTPSPFYFEDNPCTGEASGPSSKRRYVQAGTLVVCWRGVELRIYANDYGNSGKGIRLQWSAEHRTGEIAFIPESFQYARLIAKDDMR